VLFFLFFLLKKASIPHSNLNHQPIMLGFGKKKRNPSEKKEEVLEQQKESEEASENERSEESAAESAAKGGDSTGGPSGDERALREFSELLFATLSHELRTPLNGVLGMVQLMRDEIGDNERLETLESSAWHMQAVLMTLVNFSKIQSNWGNLPEHSEWLSVYEVLNQFAKNLKARAGARHLKIEVKHQNKKLRLRGDFDHLTNIVETAILGSLEASQPSEAETVETLTITWSKEGPNVKIVVENPLEVWTNDRGAQISNISQMLRGTKHKTIRMEFLYWAVASALLEHYEGGMMFQKMEGGKGVVTTLSFQMKSMLASESAAKPVGGLSLSEGKKEKASIDELPFRKRVLLVEDDPVSRKILGFLLEKFGQEVVSVKNGEEAVELLAKDQNFNLVFMDIDMPVLDGMSATRAIRMGESGDAAMEIPIAAVTAFNTLSDQSKFKKAGMNFALSKPVSKTELRRVLLEVERMENEELPANTR
jgi:CheY-like chemotaxis protein